MIFGLNDCVAYKAKTAHDDIVGWSVVLASEIAQRMRDVDGIDVDFVTRDLD